jgi:hypothetical protein
MNNKNRRNKPINEKRGLRIFRLTLGVDKDGNIILAKFKKFKLEKDSRLRFCKIHDVLRVFFIPLKLLKGKESK